MLVEVDTAAVTKRSNLHMFNVWLIAEVREYT